ncbi:WSC-domain-containing protein [Lojkania enalia]|uniref:WSC-domain-containing protein n=1 Tax=Lojkania enalia TaxID=147567 RepID=A0A9P4KI31_9PLEO|nr:WSC-domain-containing protein [Didymosphaeria enalia]
MKIVLNHLLASSLLVPALVAEVVPESWQVEEGWKYLGCHADAGNLMRTLSYKARNDDKGMNNLACMTQCQDLHFRYAGPIFGKECFCGDHILNDGAAGPQIGSDADEHCNMTCPGAIIAGEICGGNTGITLWEYSQPPVCLFPLGFVRAQAFYSIPAITCYRLTPSYPR